MTVLLELIYASIKIACLYFLVHYLTRDLQRKLGLLKQEVRITLLHALAIPLETAQHGSIYIGR